jgi:hypothetical protein
MFTTAASWLEKSAADIDALNVFPVPDGDTGTNMLLTMRSTVEEAYRAPDRSAWAVARAMAQGSLMGARGNSGVILSQIFRGIARALEGKESFDAGDFVQALHQGSALAYKALSRPAEGTMLTVLKDASVAAQEAYQRDPDLVNVIEAATAAARDSVASTPTLLPVLREAGVVDAGGQGLYVILEGVLHFLRGDTEMLQHRKPQIVPSSIPLVTSISQLAARDEEPYGYCIEFLIRGRKLVPDKIRRKLEGKGQCVIAVGDEQAVRVHIHSFDPGSVFRYATSLGTLHQIKVQNMDDQHQEFVEKARATVVVTDIAIVPVAAGEGLVKVFQSLGAAAVVPGGQTMNPSTQELLQAVESVPADKVILLPNNKNILLTANQVLSLTNKRVKVVPTTTIPQGIAAILSFNYDAGLETNASLMEEASQGVKTLEVTRAIRSTQIGDFKIKKKQAIGFIDGELAAVGDEPAAVLWQLLQDAGLEQSEVVTIYYGANTKPSRAEAVAEKVRQEYPQVQVELINGGQPHYNYIVSVE